MGDVEEDFGVLIPLGPIKEPEYDEITGCFLAWVQEAKIIHGKKV